MNKETKKAGHDLTKMFKRFSEEITTEMNRFYKKDVETDRLLALLLSHICALLLGSVFPNYLNDIEHFGYDVKHHLFELEKEIKIREKAKKGT